MNNNDISNNENKYEGSRKLITKNKAFQVLSNAMQF